jgi:protein subunit release factor A
MSETTQPTNTALPIEDYLGAFITIHIDGFLGIHNQLVRWADPFDVYHKHLESQFVIKYVYNSASECFGYDCDREYSETTSLVENPSAFKLLQHESGIHFWQVPSMSMSRRCEFKVFIEVVPLIPAQDFIWENNKDIERDAFYTYGAGGSSVVKSLSGGCLKHRPTGVSARATEAQSYLHNLLFAGRLLSSRLFAHELGMLNNTKLVRTVDLTNSIIRNERTGFVSTDIESFMEGNIHPSL